MDSFIIYSFFGLVGVVIGGFILRMIFRINERTKYQQAMVWLLIRLCEKEGITDDELMRIRRSFEIENMGNPVGPQKPIDKEK